MSAHPQPAAMTADEFRTILEAAGLKIAQAAKTLGVCVATAHHWLNEETPISEAGAQLIRDRIGSQMK